MLVMPMVAAQQTMGMALVMADPGRLNTARLRPDASRKISARRRDSNGVMPQESVELLVY